VEPERATPMYCRSFKKIADRQDARVSSMAACRVRIMTDYGRSSTPHSFGAKTSEATIQRGAAASAYEIQNSMRIITRYGMSERGRGSRPARQNAMSASLIGWLGSSAFGYPPPLRCRCRSRAGASLRNRRQGPSIMGFEDEGEQSLPRSYRPMDGRSKRTCELTSSIVPRETSVHCWMELEFPPIGFDPSRFSYCCRGALFSGPAELVAAPRYAAGSFALVLFTTPVLLPVMTERLPAFARAAACVADSGWRRYLARLRPARGS
jgi:hypothetical protein